jgi:hypothetical protein
MSVLWTVIEQWYMIICGNILFLAIGSALFRKLHSTSTLFQSHDILLLANGGCIGSHWFFGVYFYPRPMLNEKFRLVDHSFRRGQSQ